MSSEYAHEKATKIILTLATSAASIQQRLEWAFMPSLLSLQSDSEEDYLPEELFQKIALLVDRMTSKEDEADEGTLVATLSTMTELELEDCAEKLTAIALEVIERHSEANSFHTEA